VTIALNMTEPLLSVSQICEKYKMNVMMNYNTIIFVKKLINVLNESIINYKTLRNRLYYYKPKTIRVDKANTANIDYKSNDKYMYEVQCEECDPITLITHNKLQ
jgi:hypothetical protein